jgi:MinD-like ATPase involved in chromosome partitioning or flagellar assembly
MNLSMDCASRNLNVLVINADLSFPSMILLSSLKMAGVRQTTQIINGKQVDRTSSIEVVTLDMDITIVHSPWEDEQNPIMEEVAENGRKADVILINTSIGFSSNAKAIFKAADEILLCTDANLARLIDTYSIVKMIRQIARDTRIGIIMTAQEHEALKGYKKINDAAQHFLGDTLISYGYIPWDADVTESIRKKSPLRPTAAAAQYIRVIGDKLFKSLKNQQKQFVTKEPSFIDKLFTVSGQAMSVGDTRYL